jgi:ArsR family transcriptional regulator
MNICIPVVEDDGSASPLYPHFGSAPVFMIVDTDSGACRVVPNHNLDHSHGMCTPLDALAGESIDALVVGGIGRVALAKLGAAGVRVYLSTDATVGQAVAAFKAGTLQPVTQEMACAHHGGGHP